MQENSHHKCKILHFFCRGSWGPTCKILRNLCETHKPSNTDKYIICTWIYWYFNYCSWSYELLVSTPLAIQVTAWWGFQSCGPGSAPATICMLKLSLYHSIYQFDSGVKGWGKKPAISERWSSFLARDTVKEKCLFLVQEPREHKHQCPPFPCCVPFLSALLASLWPISAS